MIKRQSTPCPGCGHDDLDQLLSIDSVPVNSVHLIKSRQQAEDFPTGRITLVACTACGLVFNLDFDSNLVSYDVGYESTQAFSQTYRTFMQGVVARLVSRYDLTGKRVIEVGCGQGEFLEQLRLAGVGSITGFDPAFDPSRPAFEKGKGVDVVARKFDPAAEGDPADLVACLMTLEHINVPHDFMRALAQSLNRKSDSVLYLQIPNAEKLFADAAFWDVYYEHACYFSEASLRAVAQSVGLRPLDVWTEYDDQYLASEFVRADEPADPASSTNDVAKVLDLARSFARRSQNAIKSWRSFLDQAAAEGRTTVLWGGGSKAVAFMTALDSHHAVSHAVDINPVKADTYLAGSGIKVIAPSSLMDNPPDHVVVMNPIYVSEISSQLSGLGLAPEIHPVTKFCDR